MSSSYWMVADMDGTVVELPGFAKSGEKYRAKGLTDSPCMEPLVRWLRLGGKALIVTSDDGNAPQRKVWHCIPSELRKDRRVLLSTSDGAALWFDDEQGEITADSSYTTKAVDNGNTGLPPVHMETILQIAREMHISFFSDLLAERSNPQLMPLLTNMHQKAYGKILDEVASGSQTMEEALSLDNLLHFQRITRGSMLWRNQSGPTEQWTGYVEHDPKDEAARREAFAALCETYPSAHYTNLFVMGMPRSISAKYIAEAQPKLEQLGLSASAAPNTVCIKNSAVDKSLPLHYLSTSGELALERSFAFG
jgi:hypothetical protein